jgi:hypothetical protein
LYPSRGLTITGIEVKSSRGDWLRELKNPQKAESIFCRCDYFYLFTADDKVAKLEEIPASWGWLAIKGSKVYTMKEAPKNKIDFNVDRSFMCALLKRATQGLIHPSTIESTIEERVNASNIYKDRVINDLQDQIDKLQQKIKQFEDAAGIRLNDGYGYSDVPPRKVGEVIKLLANNKIDQYKTEVNNIKERAETFLRNINTAVDIFNELNPDNNGIQKGQ